MSQSKMQPKKTVNQEEVELDSSQSEPDKKSEISDNIILWVSTLAIWISLAVSLINIKSESTVLWLLGSALLIAGILTNFLKSKKKKTWTFIAISIVSALIAILTNPWL